MIEESPGGKAGTGDHGSPAALAGEEMEELSGSVRIDPMAAADIPRILEIERESQPEPWSAELFREELNRVHSQALVARVGAEKSPVGYICFWEVAGEIQILNIAVHKDYRRRGIGRALLHYALRFGRSRSARFASLEVRQTNAAARKLYEAIGFRVVGERPDYYGSHESALIMELDL